MFSSIFNTVLKSVAIPIFAIILLQSTFLGLKGAFFTVTIAVTFTNLISILIKIIKILPNLVLLKPKKVIQLFVSIFIEIVSIFGFWIYYTDHFNK